MLVLTRKQSEKIQIGNNITITVIRLKGKSVRLGIEAPNSVSVLRGELAFDAVNDSADIHSPETGSVSDSDQAASETIIEGRIPRSQRPSLTQLMD
ncbi:MAG: carbon storage regulator [Planctomycetota bacterium]